MYVKGKTAKLFINDTKLPHFIVSELKMGVHKTGEFVFLDIGTAGIFRDLKVTSKTKGTQ
ncbi:hypothetical protein KUH03_29990 [Sphingobacterium sp. E70]|uniref:hypothetical protein n=1 Tax=Sphingobacterium sp. E70 TaxID=2853439 RepID=UPI00211C4253|nr:hypothetical protein [Sphingobacterium sp. E70]ULT23395.1 hypothetical protein KUH03_29990 [Sphingobacterium sp. E70]